MWKIVIQNRQTLKYLTDGNEWNPELRLAVSFERIHDAAQHCAAHGFRDVHLVMGIPSKDGRFTAASRTVLPVPRTRSVSEAETRPGSDALAG